ncbi:MAG: Fe-S cluster assembly protein SufB [Planctomycetales bacterium 4484_113]|nr:MAG: Fe-S cluster assembly protein SufB [Planctomycetales bacterium 4484_113]
MDEREIEALKKSKEGYEYGFADEAEYGVTPVKGLSEEVVNQIADIKGEPAWMREFRLKALKIFQRKPELTWGPDISPLNLDDIYYYLKPKGYYAHSWDEVPERIKRTFQRLGIPEAEQKFLAGVEAQYDSEAVYGRLKNQWEEQGVIFETTDQAVKQHPELLRDYFATVVKPDDNRFAALNSAVWSGGSFVYIPPGVTVEIPLQAYFRINARSMGQFERTLIIADEGSFVHYVEGCTAPVYSVESLHSGVIEVIVKRGARVRYSTVQNWSSDIYNLVTQRAIAHEDATMEWVDGNLGSKVTMKYPAVVMKGRGARGEILSISFAGSGQHQDAGAKLIHLAPDTTGRITSKSISVADGRAGYRGLVQVLPGATGCKAHVECDALLMNRESRTDTYPYIDVHEPDAEVAHEARVSRVSEEQLFYLMSRGISRTEAVSLVVSGFIQPITKELPLEYAVELNRLIQMEMEESVG